MADNPQTQADRVTLPSGESKSILDVTPEEFTELIDWHDKRAKGFAARARELRKRRPTGGS